MAPEHGRFRAWHGPAGRRHVERSASRPRSVVKRCLAMFAALSTCLTLAAPGAIADTVGEATPEPFQSVASGKDSSATAQSAPDHSAARRESPKRRAAPPPNLRRRPPSLRLPRIRAARPRRAPARPHPTMPDARQYRNAARHSRHERGHSGPGHGVHTAREFQRSGRVAGVSRAQSHRLAAPGGAHLLSPRSASVRDRQLDEAVRLVRGACELDPTFIAPHLTLASWFLLREPSQALLQVRGGARAGAPEFRASARAAREPHRDRDPVAVPRPAARGPEHPVPAQRASSGT